MLLSAKMVMIRELNDREALLVVFTNVSFKWGGAAIVRDLLTHCSDLLRAKIKQSVHATRASGVLVSK